MGSAVLAIDVTGPGGGAALAKDGAVELALIPPAVARGRDLVPQVRELLSQHDLKLEDLEGIACAVGPGSFTGIRIGIATAATLAYAAKRPVVAIGSLHGIAAQSDAADVAVVLDARRDHVYAARFRDGALDGAYRHVPAAEFAAELADDTVVLGDARTRYPDLFDGHPGSADSTVRPDVVARLGVDAFANGEAIEPAELRPMYLRLSDPEIRRTSG